MEQAHLSTQLSFRSFFAALGILLSFALAGCNNPVPNPELLDPIYTDLNKEADFAEKEAAEKTAELKKLREEVKGYSARDPNKARSIREVYKLEKMVAAATQQSEYYKIRAKQRLAFVQKDYLKAFEANKPWPDPEEYQNYLEVKKLRQAPRSWDARVPKMTRHDRGVAAAGGEKKKEEAKAAGGHE